MSNFYGECGYLNGGLQPESAIGFGEKDFLPIKRGLRGAKAFGLMADHFALPVIAGQGLRSGSCAAQAKLGAQRCLALPVEQHVCELQAEQEVAHAG